MKPEKLKVIAEGMGYEAEIIDKGFTYERLCVRSDIGALRVYKPLTNAEQCMEIMERLDAFLNKETSGWYCLIGLSDGRGKTINEAVCNASYEYFNNENN